MAEQHTDPGTTDDHGGGGATLLTSPPLAEWRPLLRTGLPALRKARAWSQADLAQRSGLNRRTIMRLEGAEAPSRHPGKQTLSAVARAFGYIHLADLWMALQSAGKADHATPLLVGERIRRLVLALMDCTPEQQQLIEGLILCWAASQRADALGQAAMLDMDLVLRPG